MRGEWKRVLLGCAASLVPRGGGTPASQRVAGGSTIGPRGRRRWASAARRPLRAKESPWRPGLLGSPFRTPSEELVLGGGRSTSASWPLRSGSWSSLLRTRWAGLSSPLGTTEEREGHLSYSAFSAQEQGLRRISDGARGGLGVGPLLSLLWELQKKERVTYLTVPCQPKNRG